MKYARRTLIYPSLITTAAATPQALHIHIIHDWVRSIFCFKAETNHSCDYCLKVVNKLDYLYFDLLAYTFFSKETFIS